MSYRITVRDYELGEDYKGQGDLYHQIFGNNYYSNRLEEYLKKHGMETDGDGCFRDFKIPDIQEFLELVLELQDELVDDLTWYNFEPAPHMKVDNPDRVISYWDYKLDSATVLLMYNFYLAIKDYLDSEWDESIGGVKYKMKPGKHIYLSGF